MQIGKFRLCIGGSDERTTNEAWLSGISRSAASVLCVNVEPIPGVSIRIVPSAKMGAG